VHLIELRVGITVTVHLIALKANYGDSALNQSASAFPIANAGEQLNALSP
jgi:hypothetical protein